jgi:hypothetical protein
VQGVRCEGVVEIVQFERYKFPIEAVSEIACGLLSAYWDYLENYGDEELETEAHHNAEYLVKD